jgi:hypothetical protein
MHRKSRTLFFIVLGCLSLGFATGTFAGGKTKKDFVVVPAGEAKFGPLNPKDPAHSPQVAFLQGDPKTGPVAFLLKTQGPAPLHWHTSDYWAVTLEGVTQHWPQGKDAEAKDNPPGTFWYQPGGDASTAHADVCLTGTGCTLFIVMDKGQDFFPVPGKG